MKNYMLFDICPNFSELFKSFYGGEFNIVDIDQQELEKQVSEICKNYLTTLVTSTPEKITEANSLLRNLSLLNDGYKLILSDQDNFILLIDIVYDSSKTVYEFLEFEYARFGKLNYLFCLDPLLLYLCGRYYYSINDKNRAEAAMFISLCVIASLSKNNSNITSNLKYYEDYFEDMKQYIGNDWLALHPIMTHMIGMYYKEKKEYDKAMEWFTIGAQLDYEGRQSQVPFDEVSKNKYELAMMYFEGLSVKQDYQKAFEWFSQVAADIGTEHFPALGDMFYEGLGVETDRDFAFDCYSCLDETTKSLYYFELDEKQKERLETLLLEMVKECKASNDYHYLAEVYYVKLNNQDKYIELEKLACVARKEEESAETIAGEVMEIVDCEIEPEVVCCYDEAIDFDDYCSEDLN